MKYVNKILYAILITVTAILLVAFLIPQMFGIKIKAVVSGSMEPFISVGSIVYIRPCDFEEINVGNDITYKTDSGIFVTHRVIKKDYVTKTVQTKGTANDIADTPVEYDSILGKVVLSLPCLGAILCKLSSLKGKLVLVTALLTIVFFAIITEKH